MRGRAYGETENSKESVENTPVTREWRVSSRGKAADVKSGKEKTKWSASLGG